MDDQLLPYLPQVVREDPATRIFLRAFEKVLVGRPDGPDQTVTGLEEIIADLPRRLAPGSTPDEFLPWLSQWVALSLRTDIYTDPTQNNALRRDFIAQVGRLYPMRGTKWSLKELLRIFTGRSASTICVVETVDRPYHFSVTLDLTDKMVGRDQAEIDRLWEIAYTLIRKEKPAHTYFTLTPEFPSFRLGPLPPDNKLRAQVGGIVGSTYIGNTRLGSARWTRP